MDRSEEFLRVAKIFCSDGGLELCLAGNAAPRSEFFRDCATLLSMLGENDELLKRICRVASSKEFSSDPTQALQDLSVQFERKVQFIQSNLQRTKLGINQTSRSQESQHRDFATQYLSKSLSSQVTKFKAALKEHTQNLVDRNKRINKYGGTSGVSSPSVFVDSDQAGKFAMFSGQGLQDSSSLASIERNRAMRSRKPQVVAGGQRGDTVQVHSSQEQLQSPESNFPVASIPTPGSSSSLFHRRNVANSLAATTTGTPQTLPAASVSNSWAPQLAQTSYQKTPESRLQYAEKFEKSLREMGQLFAQMTSLIAEQGEVLTRIEDDVEIGHQNTVEGFASIQQAYDITKGNRSLILKIFGILFLCVFLFLVWT